MNFCRPDQFIGFEANHIQSAPENLRVGFISPKFAREKNIREKLRDPELLQNHAQPPIKIRNHGELKSRTQFFQDLDYLGIQFPNAGLGEMFVNDFEEVIAVELVQ